MQRYTFPHDLQQETHTFLHELQQKVHTFLHELLQEHFSKVDTKNFRKQPTLLAFFYSSSLILRLGIRYLSVNDWENGEKLIHLDKI